MIYLFKRNILMSGSFVNKKECGVICKESTFLEISYLISPVNIIPFFYSLSLSFPFSNLSSTLLILFPYL